MLFQPSQPLGPRHSCDNATGSPASLIAPICHFHGYTRARISSIRNNYLPPTATRAHARFPNPEKHTHLFAATGWELARTCSDLPGLARTCSDLRGGELARTCPDLRGGELARTCPDLPGPLPRVVYIRWLKLPFWVEATSERVARPKTVFEPSYRYY